ncbi:MAG: signal peptidase I [Clostridiales bacterium]|jgi:signal peptidase|nr:signal peptidase I [Clostridiales bacterium]
MNLETSLDALEAPPAQNARRTIARLKDKAAVRKKAILQLNPIVISEQHPGAIASGSFRLYAPDGFRFAAGKKSLPDIYAKNPLGSFEGPAQSSENIQLKNPLLLKSFSYAFDDDDRALDVELSLKKQSSGKCGSIVIESLELEQEDAKEAKEPPWQLRLEDFGAGIIPQNITIRTVLNKNPGKPEAFINFLIGIFLAVLLFTLATSFFSQMGYSIFGYRSFIIISESMAPAINKGAYIISRQANAGSIRVGDIISYYADPELKTTQTHRVETILISNGSLSFVTKGDANSVTDRDPVLPRDILGVAALKIEGLGSVLLFIRQPLNLALCILIMLIIYFAPDYFRYALPKSEQDDVEDLLPSVEMEGDAETKKL